MRTFQFSDAKSHKFWNIDVTGTSFTVTYGKVGTAGQTQTKTFPTAEKAQAEADKLVREKTGKGYAETTPTAAASEAEAFGKALVANPHDRAAWGAFADFLAEQGDPRGEFMQVQLALEDEGLSKAERDKLKKREAALLKAHEQDWLGPLAGFVPPEPAKKPTTRYELPRVEFTFARGWLDRVRFAEITVDMARALGTAESAKFLRELVVEEADAEVPVGQTQQYVDTYYEPGPDVPADIDPYDAPGFHALCRCPHLAAVRVFRLGESADDLNGVEDEYMNCHTSGDLAYHFVKQMPHLEELYLLAHRVDAAKVFALPLPNLRVLQLYHSNRYPLEKLAANKSLTKLTHILCHPHAYEDDGDDEDGGGAYIRFAQLKAICRSPHLTSLTHLRLRLTDFGDQGAKEIVQSGILKRLKVLDLQGGCITDAGAELLAASPDLKRLEFVNLSRNAMSSIGTNVLQATGVKLNVAAQHNEIPGGGNEYLEYLGEGDIE